jgi:hypothetical protein
MFEYIAQQPHLLPLLFGEVSTLLGTIGDFSPLLFLAPSVRTLRIALGLTLFIVGLFLWGLSEKTTKRNRRGIGLMLLGVFLVVIISLIKGLLWVSTLGG